MLVDHNAFETFKDVKATFRKKNIFVNISNKIFRYRLPFKAFVIPNSKETSLEAKQ